MQCILGIYYLMGWEYLSKNADTVKILQILQYITST